MRVYLYLLALAAATAAFAIVMLSDGLNSPPGPDAVLLSLRDRVNGMIDRQIVPQRQRLLRQFALVEAKRRAAGAQALRSALAQEQQEIARLACDCNRRDIYAREMIERIDSALRRLERASGGPLPPGLGDEITTIQRDLSPPFIDISDIEVDQMLRRLAQGGQAADPPPPANAMCVG